MKRKVQFKDCHVGDVFKMSLDSPWLYGVYDNGKPIKASDTLRAKVVSIDGGDCSIKIDLYINKEKEPRTTGWLYRQSFNIALLISNNLEFLPKRKNNYW